MVWSLFDRQNTLDTRKCLCFFQVYLYSGVKRWRSLCFNIQNVKKKYSQTSNVWRMIECVSDLNIASTLGYQC